MQGQLGMLRQTVKFHSLRPIIFLAPEHKNAPLAKAAGRISGKAWFNRGRPANERPQRVDDQVDNDIPHRLMELRLEHRDLDEAITRMADDPTADQLRLRRLKKRKLLLKDTIARLESRLIPDLDA